MLPELFTGAFQNVKVDSVQKDLCPECAKGIASIMRLLKGSYTISIANQNGESLIIVN